MKNLLFIVNPISGDKDKTKVAEDFVALAEQSDFVPFYFETTGKNDEQKIEEILAQHSFDRVVVAGGDGTAKLVAKVLLKHPDILLGILPQGSANGLAKSLNLPTNFQKIGAIVLGETTKELNVIAINNEPCIHLSDAGFNAKLVEKYEKGEQRGFLGYASQLIDTIQENTPLNCTVSIEDASTDFTAQMVVIGNAPKYGFGGVINPNGCVNDGLFDIIIVKAMGLPQFIKMMAGAEEHQYTDEEVVMLQGQKATITFQEPTPFQIDGEYLGEQTELTIELLPTSLQVLCEADSI